MIPAIEHARENRIPFFGICLGMQMAVVEFARQSAAWRRANSSEFDEQTPIRSSIFFPSRRHVTEKGAHAAGAYPCSGQGPSFAADAYGVPEISERHRHRYEFNNDYRDSPH